MLLRLELELSSGRKKTHHSKDYDSKRKDARIKLKGNCVVCGNKIKDKYRRKLYSEKCQVLYDRKRKHTKRKKI